MSHNKDRVKTAWVILVTVYFFLFFTKPGRDLLMYLVKQYDPELYHALNE